MSSDLFKKLAQLSTEDAIEAQKNSVGSIIREMDSQIFLSDKTSEGSKILFGFEILRDISNPIELRIKAARFIATSSHCSLEDKLRGYKHLSGLAEECHCDKIRNLMIAIMNNEKYHTEKEREWGMKHIIGHSYCEGCSGYDAMFDIKKQMETNKYGEGE